MALIVQIVSAASTGERYFVDIGGGQIQVNQNIILWSSSSIQWNDCWEMTPEGRIVCVADPQLVIGIDGDNNVITVQRNESDSTQCWTIARLSNSAACTIQNKSSSQYLTVSGSSIEGGPLLITETLGSGMPDGQYWIIAPAQMPIPRQYYIQTLMGVSIEEETFYVMTVSGEDPGAESVVVIDTWQPCAASQLWTLNYDGTISSAVGSSLVLTASGAPGGDNPVTIGTAVPGNPLQIWQVYDDGTIRVQIKTQNPPQQCLNVSGDKLSSGKDVITFEVQSGPPSNELWQLLPAQPITLGTWFSLQVGSSAEGHPFVLTAAGAAANSEVTIEPFQPGAANQLWIMQADGVIVSAFNQTMALTANSINNQVTITPEQSGNAQQQWYLKDGGLVVNYSNSQLQYLNAQGGGAAYAGQPVFTYGFEVAPNTTWSVMPYQPDPSGQWFSIRSATPGTGMPYLLTAWPHGLVLATLPQDSTIVADGLPGINQLWRMTLQGVIVSAVNPNLMLTVNSDGNVVLAPSSGSKDQQWAWGTSASLPGATGKYGKDIRCGVLQNLGGSGNVLHAGQVNNFFLPITLAAEQGSGTDDDNPQTYPGQFWCVVPFLPAFDQWTTIRSLAGGGLFLQLPAKPVAKVGFEASVGPQIGSLSTWQFAWPGYIVSATNPEIVLSVLWVDKTTNTLKVVALPRQPGPQPFQLWTATPDGALVNQMTGRALEVFGSAALGWTVNVTTTALSGSPGQTQQWEFSPGAALQTVLAQPPAPYPIAATPGETTAYTYINQSLGLTSGGLRTQYANLAAPLASYQSRLNVLPQPTEGVSTTEWTDVVGQLNDELTAAIAVQTLFQQVTALYLELSQAQAMALSEVVTAAELPNGMQTKFKPEKKGLGAIITDVIGGLVYTGLNMAGTYFGDPEAGKQVHSLTYALPCVANLMQTGISSGEAGFAYRRSAPSGKYQAVLNNIYKYEMSVLELQQALLSMFQAAGGALGEIETLILADWGKLQAVYGMIRTLDGISSLYWPSTMTPILASRILPGYVTGVLQTLIPANGSFKITATLHTNTQASPMPKPGLSSDFTQFIEDNDDGTQNVYSINANQELMAMVWANGTDPASFFRGFNGWDLPVVYPISWGQWDTAIANLTADIVVTIRNFTKNSLTLTIQCTGLLGAGGYLTSAVEQSDEQVTIVPYGMRNFAGTIYSAYYNGEWNVFGMAGSFSVTDAENESVVDGNIENHFGGGKDPPTFSWNISATAPYRVSQNVVSTSGMYFFNCAIYDL
jgi:hypothetical protein